MVQVPGALVLALASRVLLACRRSGIVTMVHVSQVVFFSVALLIGMRLSDFPAVVALAYSAAVTVTSVLAYVLAARTLGGASDRLR